MKRDKLFDLWEGRDPEFEVQYEEPIIKSLCDYGKGTSQYQESRAKVLGAGYEAYIMAFFIGLYFDKSMPLGGETKKFGWAIRNWGNVDARKGRRNYHEITKFMFVALVARADIDFIALDKGEITARKAVDIHIQKMEEYANYGFYYMLKEKLEINPNYFYRNSAFLDIFTSLIKEEPNIPVDYDDDDEPESLD